MQGASLLAGALALQRALGGWDFDPLLRGGPGLCVFHRLTGMDCPGCGMTRAFLALAHGDVAGAWQWHPFSVPLAVALLGMAWAPPAWGTQLKAKPWFEPALMLALGALLAWWAWAKVLPWF